MGGGAVDFAEKTPFVAFLAAVALLSPPGLAGLLQPEHFEYRGAFRVADNNGGPEGCGTSCEWSFGGGLVYSPEGDPAGPDDGNPGSLYLSKVREGVLAQMTIPAPVVSADRDWTELPRAAYLTPKTSMQHFYVYGERGPTMGVTYMPPRPGDGEGRLWFSWGNRYSIVGCEHWQRHVFVSNLDLDEREGGWHLRNPDDPTPINTNCVGGSATALPASWAAEHVGGRALLVGRYRDGSVCAPGPTLFAVAPWESAVIPDVSSWPSDREEYVELKGNLGDCPLLPEEEALPYTTLLRYTDENPFPGISKVDGFGDWAWVERPAGRALALSATKNHGRTFYGDDSHCVEVDDPDGPHVPGICGTNKQYYGEDMRATVLLFDPADFEAIAAGTRAPDTPVPYASFDLEPFLYKTREPSNQYRIGGMAYDNARGLMYVSEVDVEGEGHPFPHNPIVHVFRLGGSATKATGRLPGMGLEVRASLRASPGGRVPLVLSRDERLLSVEAFTVRGGRVCALCPDSYGPVVDVRLPAVAAGRYLLVVRTSRRTVRMPLVAVGSVPD